jgi:flavin reductase (DIM6/NTAB) family NADH-FMN oxidoreductase RutF
MSSETPRVTSEEFRRACGRFATGVAIATVTDGTGAPHGLTVSSFTSVSLEPPLALICLGHDVTNIQHFCNASYFGINVLTEDQQDLSERFARRGYDRFDGIGWHRGSYGVPLLPGCLAEMECRVHRRIEMGDHDIFVGEMIRVQIGEGKPLVYFASMYRELKSL